MDGEGEKYRETQVSRTGASCLIEMRGRIKKVELLITTLTSASTTNKKDHGKKVFIPNLAPAEQP